MNHTDTWITQTHELHKIHDLLQTHELYKIQDTRYKNHTDIRITQTYELHKIHESHKHMNYTNICI